MKQSLGYTICLGLSIGFLGVNTLRLAESTQGYAPEAEVYQSQPYDGVTLGEMIDHLEQLDFGFDASCPGDKRMLTDNDYLNSNYCVEA